MRHKLREGEGGKASRSKPELILCREDGRVTLFMSIDNGHLKTCGSPGVDWRYMSPKSICIEVESKRSGRGAGSIIEMAQCMAKMTGYKLRDELVKCDIGRMRK